jgi:hypothetical protein
MANTVTNGVGCISRINITSSALTLVLIGASQRLTYQITAEATDNFGTVIPDVELFYNIVAGNDVAEVSDSGLVTATGAGQAIVQVSAAAFGNTINLFTPDGIPINAVYSEQAISIEEGVPFKPSFSFTLSESSVTISPTSAASVTITQTIGAHGDPGPVTYSFYGAEGVWNWADSIPSSPHPTIWFAFSNNVSGSTTTTFTVSAAAGAGNTPSTPGTYTGYIIGTAQQYNPNAPSSQKNPAPADQGTFTFKLPFTVIVS